MRYTVTWLPDAEDKLADLWTQASDRQAVADAANRIERELLRDADRKGQEDDGQRILVDRPLAVTFTVSPDDCLVTIVWVEQI
ncbi:MAG TPA: hypothetical protein VH643_10225 [Gemmataceae bacterium]|jgi:hypothetical protein